MHYCNQAGIIAFDSLYVVTSYDPLPFWINTGNIWQQN